MASHELSGRARHFAMALGAASVLGSIATACEEEETNGSGAYAFPDASSGIVIPGSGGAGEGGSTPDASDDASTATATDGGADARADADHSDAMIDPFLPAPEDDGAFAVPSGPAAVDHARDLVLAYFALTG